MTIGRLRYHIIVHMCAQIGAYKNSIFREGRTHVRTNKRTYNLTAYTVPAA